MGTTDSVWSSALAVTAYSPASGSGACVANACCWGFGVGAGAPAGCVAAAATVVGCAVAACAAPVGDVVASSATDGLVGRGVADGPGEAALQATHTASAMLTASIRAPRQQTE